MVSPVIGVFLIPLLSETLGAIVAYLLSSGKRIGGVVMMGVS
jgi:hypothetical protein